jgi:hypothetical protein
MDAHYIGETYSDWQLIFLRHTELMMCLGWWLSMQPRAAEAGEGCGGAATLAVASCTVVGSAGPTSSTTFSSQDHNIGGGDLRHLIHPPLWWAPWVPFLFYVLCSTFVRFGS